MGDMFIGASSWHAAYTNCGHDDSASVCLSSTSYASSNGINDGPPSAWVLIPKPPPPSTANTTSPPPPPPPASPPNHATGLTGILVALVATTFNML
jgi:hypothetical protein